MGGFLIYLGRLECVILSRLVERLKSSLMMSIPPLPFSLVVIEEMLGSFNISIIFLTPSLIPHVRPY
ncbi:hypothetical protein WK32_17800 [Burkholderia vietnamiensis]|nr:hypothetical protein WK32_17800 [Burkholderia vietnamiensis]